MKSNKRLMSRSTVILIVVFALFVAVSPGLAQEVRTKIRISYPNISICCLALFAAQQWKIFDQNGLDVEIIQMRSQAANSALASGDIHYVAGVGPNSVAATLRASSTAFRNEGEMPIRAILSLWPCCFWS